MSDPSRLEITRRHLFARCGLGLGSMALASLLNEGRAIGEGARPIRRPDGPRGRVISRRGRRA